MSAIKKYRIEPGSYFVHLTDLHLEREKSICWQALESFVKQVNEMQPEPAFVVVTGDIVFADMNLTTRPEQVKTAFSRYQQIMSGLSVPVYNVVGNHDMVLSAREPGTGGYGKELFEKYCGPRYQSFDYGDWHCVVLDEWVVKRKDGLCADTRNALLLTKDIDLEQLDWLKNDLSRCASDKDIVIFTHNSLLNDEVLGLAQSRNQILWEKVSAVIPPRANVIEVAGCNHMNTFFKKANWRFITTAAFCGGWWVGKSIDLNEPGYALMVTDNILGLRQYYRPTGGSLAIASPKTGRIVKERYQIDAIDATRGIRVVETIDGYFLSPGWNSVKICIEGHSEYVEVFREPGPSIGNIASENAFLQFELVEPLEETLVVYCNGSQIGQIEKDAAAGKTIELFIKSELLRNWTFVQMEGNAVISSPRLTLNGKTIKEERTAKLESVRPEWFGDIRKLTWDISKRQPTTPARYPGNKFYFRCG